MAHNTLLKLFLPLLLLLLLLCSGVSSNGVTFYIENRCSYTIWPAWSPSISDVEPFDLQPSVIAVLTIADPSWFGSFWARTQCSSSTTSSKSNYFSCATGDCGSGTTACSATIEPEYPVTELIFKINNDSVVNYDLSLVHGHNAKVRIKPNGGTLVDGSGSGPCPMVECNNDLSSVCPSTLIAYNQNFEYVGCKNSCDVIDDPKYCCLGVACIPDENMKMFKKLCPDAATFLGDKPPPVYQCKGADSFHITFCPADP